MQEKKQTCWLCEGDRLTACFSKYGGHYFQCQGCGLLLSSLAETAEMRHDRDSSFSPESERDLSVNIEREYSDKSQKRYCQEIRKYTEYRQKNRILDVGCGTGGFLFTAMKSGWRAVGTEVSSQAVQAAEGKGLEVHLGALRDRIFENDSFDIIRMEDVIEHLKDPLGDLHICHGLLRPGGLLVLSTVNVDSLTFVLLRERWRYIDPRYHIHLFTLKNLSLLLEKSGFRIISFKTAGLRTREDKKMQRYLRPALKLLAKIFRKGHRMGVMAVKSRE
ncbi:MAG: class I SAM-dependent methyltransferase [Candidatus Aureabacteria bacterium]|nr:class I SAM-dependent methyltransferase [Candidatus Auribacterota bacterium]